MTEPQPCSICHAAPTLANTPLAGYAIYGKKVVCYSCADDLQRADLVDGRTKYYGYLGKDAITTWTGGVLARVTYRWTIRCGFGGKQTCWNAVDAQGNRWYGRNAGDGMATTMHKAKH